MMIIIILVGICVENMTNQINFSTCMHFEALQSDDRYADIS